MLKPKKRRVASYLTRITKGMKKLERMWKHILKSELEKGRTLKVAQRIASAVVNRWRRKHGKLISQIGRHGYYPGKHGYMKRHYGRKSA